MTEGLRSDYGVAAAPFTKGPYTWDQQLTLNNNFYVVGTTGFTGTHTQTGSMNVTGDFEVLGAFTFGDAITDSFTCNGLYKQGTSGTPLVLTAGTPTFSIYTTCAGTSGSTSAEPFYLKSTLTGAGQVGGRARFHVYSNVASGSWINALKAFTEFGATGSSSGLASSLCAEMTLPNQTVPSGQYYPLEIEWVGGASTSTAGTTGSGTGAIYINATGTVTNFDAKAGLFWLNGVTAGAGKILSANSNTIRAYVASTMTARYLVVSTTEDCLTMGSATTAINLGGTYTTGMTVGGTAGTGISITSASLTDGIKISGTTPVDGIEISSACSANGINLSGANLVGITIGGSTTGVSFTGSSTDYVNFGHVATTGATALNFIDAFTGKVIETGSYASSASKGVTLNSTNARPVTFLFDDAGLALTGDIRAGLSRIYLSVDQTGSASIRALRGQVKLADGVDINFSDNACFGALNGVEGYLETAGATAMTFGANTRAAGVHSFVELRQDTTITSGGYLAGFFAELGHDSKTITGTCAGLVVDIIDSDHGWLGKWPYGIYIASGSTTTGISVGSSTTGISIAGTGAAATSKALTTAGWTINNANLGDGYGAVEADLTLTGTSAGHNAALSAWININTGTHGAGGSFIAAQTNGIYEDAGAVITGANIIFGMRMDCICGDTDAAGYYPFSIVNNANTTTALFQANAPSDVGYTSDAGTASTKIGAVPLFVQGGTTYYVRIYDNYN